MSIFRPYCLACGATFRDVDSVLCHTVGDELHFNNVSMGGLKCPKCDESFEFEISNETLILRRCVVPIGNSVVAEQRFTSLNEELDQAVLNLSWQGKVDHIKHLLDEGANVNVMDERDGRTALMKAADQGFDELVKLFLDRGADVNATSYSGKTVLMSACPKCSAGTIERILDMGADINAACEDSSTALMRAASSRDINVIILLLERGANVDARDQNGRNPLMWFSREGNTAAVKLLLEKGCDVNSVDKQGMSALMHASSENHAEVIELLKSFGAEELYGGKQLNLEDAINSNDLALVRELLDKGADVDATEEDDYQNITNLMYASRDGKYEMVRLLLDYGANVNHKSYYGITALMFASTHGHYEIIKLLLDKGASVNEVDHDSRHSALMTAAYEGHIQVVKLLLERGANINFKNSYEDTALSCACEKDHKNVVELLLQSGAIVNERALVASSLNYEIQRLLETHRSNSGTKKGSVITQKQREVAPASSAENERKSNTQKQKKWWHFW